MTAGGRIRGVFRLSFAFALLAWARPAKAQTAYGFVPVTPCRIADTRNATGPFGGPALASQSSRSFAIPSSACGIPFTAAAYSLNVTVVPSATLGYVTVWPTGQAQPLVSTLNSLDGRIKSNAAIVPAGTSGAVSVFATDATNVILDINGYFVPVTNSAALAFYPVIPCRVADTRNASGSLGGPSLVGNQTRSFPVLSSSCGIPPSAQAYSLNFTAIPQGSLGYLSVWPVGQAQPLVSTLNAPTGTVTANAAIVPAGTGGAIDLFVTNATDMVIDINGYFAPPGTGGLSLYTLTQCRVLDTRQGGVQPFSGTLNINVTGSPCSVTSAAQAYVFNATVVPPGSLGYLTLWPQGASQPLVSTLNALDGSITSNMAIVPTTNGSISAYASNPAQLILDISGYFAPGPSLVLFDPTNPLATVVKDQLGANMSIQWDILTPSSQASTLTSLGVRFVRWPGGAYSDYYHWQTNTFSASTCDQLGQPPNSDDTFDNFMTQIAGAGNFDVAITLNYGSNAACTGPADPNEAAGWVAYAKSQGYQVKYWTVGNEVYNSSGQGEVDLHSPGAHDPTTYASNVANQFYPLIKAQDPNAQVGVVVDAGLYTSDNWDSIVLANAKYDFVELHYYPENTGEESDLFLLTQAPANYAAAFSTLRAELAAAGHPNTPIFLGEYNSPNSTPGKQTVSIVNALFIGMVQGEIMKAGVQAASIFSTEFGSCFPIGAGNNSSTLYGWQDFGSYDLTPEYCDSNVDGIVPGTILPAGRALQLSSTFGAAGNQVIATYVPSAFPTVRAYVATHGTGYALMLFNLDPTNSVNVPIGPLTANSTIYSGSVTTYSKAIYDMSQSFVWSGPATTSLGNLTLPIMVTIPPWSMNVVTLQ